MTFTPFFDRYPIPPVPLAGPDYRKTVPIATSLVMAITIVWSSPAFCADRASQNEEIHSAAKIGDLKTATALLKKNHDLVFSKDSNGGTPLHSAASKGNRDMAELLLSHGADVNAKENDGMTPLHYAASEGYKELAELLLAHGAEIDARASHNSVTPLQYAVINSHKEMAELLLSHGADVNAKISAGLTALHFAADKGNRDMAEMLLEHGAEANPRSNAGLTPMLMAWSKAGSVGPTTIGGVVDRTVAVTADGAQVDYRGVMEALNKHGVPLISIERK